MIFKAIGKLINAIHEAIVSPRLVHLGLGLRRAVVMLVVLTALLLLPAHLSPDHARTIAITVLAAAVVLLITALAGFRRLLDHVLNEREISLFRGRVQVELEPLDRSVRAAEGWLAVVRRAGVALPALVFFCAWALIYVWIWADSPASCPPDPAHACTGAFLGAGDSPTFGDFLYFSTNMAFANPVPDLIARSRIAHTAATLEVLSGILLVTVYATSFFGLRGRTTSPVASAPEPHRTG